MRDEDQSPQEAAPEEETPQAEEARSDEVTELREQLEEALREKGQFRTMAQRSQADLTNYKRRVEDEKAELRRSTNSELLLKMLSVVDDMNRALPHVPDDAVAPGWLEGLHLVQRNVASILHAEGVSKIDAVGKPFDPWESEAVHYQETYDAEDGIVIEVLRHGYKLHDRVLRPAQVIVAKKPEPEVQPETTEEETE